MSEIQQLTTKKNKKKKKPHKALPIQRDNRENKGNNNRTPNNLTKGKSKLIII